VAGKPKVELIMSVIGRLMYDKTGYHALTLGMSANPLPTASEAILVLPTYFLPNWISPNISS